MCLFSGAVHHVSGTRIYAGPRDNGSSIYQRIAYAMTASVPDSLAMVLPIPTPPNPAEDAVTFVDLSSSRTFFEDLDALFPLEQLMSFGGAPLARQAPQPANLVVHDVGDFEASFVPTMKDFARLDARFQMPANVWSQLPQYADWSFCVFKLRPDPQPEPKKGLFDFLKPAPPPMPMPMPRFPRKRHPMAFDFPRRNPSQLFFPTVHVHDGVAHATAHFDHTLYAQLDNPLLPEGWERPIADTSTLYEKTKAFVRPERPMFRKKIVGDHPNKDVTL